MRSRNSLLAVLALLMAAGPVLAQTNPTGTISGKATDQQGLAMPGVTVTVESPALQGARTTITSTNGDYIFPFLTPEAEPPRLSRSDRDREPVAKRLHLDRDPDRDGPGDE